MKISELPQDLKEKALEYQRNNLSSDKKTDSLAVAFDWEHTKEGYDFWNAIHQAESIGTTNLNQQTVEDPSISDFDKIVENTIGRVRELLVTKGKEYRRNGNPYHDFEAGAIKTGLSREKVLDGFLLKHLVSIDDMTNDLDSGIMPSADKVEEEFLDVIVYTIIKKAMMLENAKRLSL